MNNHIFLILNYIRELSELERVKRWVDLSLKVAKNQEIRVVLERERSRIISMKIEIMDKMFEIQRSN